MDPWLVPRFAGALALIGALLFGLRGAIRCALSLRLGVRPRERALRIVDSLALGSGSALYVIDAAGCRLLIGATQTHVSFLAELEGRPPPPTEGIAPCGAKLASDVGRD